MNGLREALEALLKDRESSTSTHPNDYMIAPYELRELLKEYPAPEHELQPGANVTPRRGNYGGAL